VITSGSGPGISVVGCEQREASALGLASDDLGRWSDVLRGAGLRVTGPRLAVLGALSIAPHSGTEAITALARERLGAVSAQAVYNVLAAFVEAGLVRRIEPAFSPALYEVRVGDNHHHVVCRRCQATVDVDCVVGRRPCLEPSEAHGFAVDEAEVTFWGLCPACQSDDTPHTAKGQQP
jgi:Fe2+ or Zn2+ uptake regulation protein